MRHVIPTSSHEVRDKPSLRNDALRHSRAQEMRCGHHAIMRCAGRVPDGAVGCGLWVVGCVAMDGCDDGLCGSIICVISVISVLSAVRRIIIAVRRGRGGVCRGGVCVQGWCVQGWCVGAGVVCAGGEMRDEMHHDASCHTQTSS